MPTVLTQPTLKELEDLLASGRREISQIYREWRTGLSVQEIAQMRGHKDLKKVRNAISTLRILFGREDLPKQGKGRQQALNEAHSWLHSDRFLSTELTEHFEKLLLKGERTNSRRNDSYEPLLAPTHRTVYEESRRRTKDGDYSGIYIITKSSFHELHQLAEKSLLIKIGWSNNIWERLASAQTWDPDRIEILRVYPCRDPHILESKIHIALDTLGCAYEGDGGREWFSIQSMDLIDAIAKELAIEPITTD